MYWDTDTDSIAKLCDALPLSIRSDQVKDEWKLMHATLLLYISSPIIDRILRLFHWHTLQTIAIM